MNQNDFIVIIGLFAVCNLISILYIAYIMNENTKHFTEINKRQDALNENTVNILKFIRDYLDKNNK